MTNPTVTFTAPRQVEITDREMPELEKDDVLIKSEVTLISIGTELSCLDRQPDMGKNWSRPQYPMYHGYCNVGTVLEAGPDADGDLVGTRVQSYGNHALYVKQPSRMARPVRGDVVSEHAVFATMAEVAFHGVRRSGVGMGTSVVVCGLGILGQLAVRYARLSGCRPVVASDPGEGRLALLPEHPAVVPVNPRKDDLTEKVKEATRGRMADVVIELTGVPSLIPECIPLLRREGTLGIVSGPRGATTMDFHDLCVGNSVKIVGVHNGSHPVHATPSDPWTKNRDVELFLDLVADGDLEIEPFITHRRKYTDAPETYTMLLEDRTKALGVLFDWT
jgi:2-desacetyl-2-hydroxyethyl bacteriochlorophyllide A dehydrogenase